MIVSELIEKLKSLPQDSIVVYCENGSVDGEVFIDGATNETYTGKYLFSDPKGIKYNPDQIVNVVLLSSS